MGLSLEETVQSQINQISTSEQLKDFIEQHSHDIPAFCQALESQIDHAKHGQREALMAFVLYYFGYMQNLDRIAKLIAAGDVCFFVMEVCKPVYINGKPLITKQQLVNMVHVVAPYLEQIREHSTGDALSFCIRYAFEIAKPYIAPLRQHENYHIAREAIEAYRTYNCDEGTLDIIEQYYYRTGKSGFTDVLCHWVSYRHDKETGYFSKGHEEKIHQQKIAQVAFNILNHAFRQTDLTTNFLPEQEGSLYQPPNRISTDRLLLAIAACPPQGAVDLVYDMLSCAELHIRFRVEAMIYYVDFSQKIPEQRQQLIKDLLSDNEERPWSSSSKRAKINDFENLSARNLITLGELLAEMRTSGKLREIMCGIRKLPNKQQDRELIVSEIIISLQIVLNDLMSLTEGQSRYDDFRTLAYLVMDFELSIDQKNEIGDLLQLVINFSKKNHVNVPGLVISLNHYLLKLDLLDEIKEPSEMDPWDAMIIQWRQQKITWKKAAQALVDARVISDMDYFERIESNDSIDNNRPSSSKFYSLLEGNGQQKCCYCGLVPEKNDSYYFFEPFEWLVDLLHHPEVTIRQILENEEEQYSYIDITYITDGATADEETFYFECQQQYYKFRVDCWEQRSQIPVLVRTFNNLLQQLGRVERCYEIESMEGWGEIRTFFVADHFKYPEMQRYLRLPSWEVV